MYKIINWYTKRFLFPPRGWKLFRALLKGTGLNNKTFIKKLHNGALLYVNPSEHIQRQIFWHGYYEKDAILLWETFINKQSVVIDIGANIGYYSIIAAAKAKQVFAFEPAAGIRKQLEDNIRLNSFSNIAIESVALSDKTGQADLFLSANDNTGMSSLQKPENFTGQQETITITTFDDWIKDKNLEHIDCIKIDTEGAEMNVLIGMKNSLQQYRPVIFIEVIEELLNKFGHTVNEVYLFLFSIGYSAYEIDETGKLKQLSEPKEASTIVFRPSSMVKS